MFNRRHLSGGVALAGKPVRVILSITRRLFAEPTGEKAACQLVFKVKRDGEAEDRWVGRIIQLADGKSIKEIAETVYLEELRAGGQEADIGLWKTPYCREVTRTIGRLADQGYLRVLS